MKTLLRLLLALVVGLLSSCIDTHEEYWLREDGSGRAEITYHLPAAAAAIHGGASGIRDTITRFLRETPELSASDCQVTTEGNRLRVHVSTSFDSALELRKIATGDSIQSLPTAASHLAGTIAVDLHGRSLDFSRVIVPSKALPGAAFMPSSNFRGNRMLYIMHLPVAASESNATRVENAGQTLVWDIPLSQAIKAPIVTRFKMPVPLPWPLISAIAIPLSLGVCGIILLRKRRRRPPHFPVETERFP